MIKDLVFGAVVGVANIIPGVSGGTIALVLGIYSRIITALNNISIQTIKSFIKIFTFKRDNLDRFKTELIQTDAIFLIKLTIGALIAIIALARLMTYLLDNYHEPTYGFFFGIVLLSTIPPYRLIKKKTISTLLAAIIAISGLVVISNSITRETKLKKAQVKHEMRMEQRSLPVSKTEGIANHSKDNILYLLYIFLLGSISISAMILPGVSGSLVLLLMGGYFEIINSIANWDIPVLFVFAIGCLAGIFAFSRLLCLLLKEWHDQTMSFLLGLVVGSLWMIWPFKTIAIVGNETIYLGNRIPDTFGSLEICTISTALIGMIIVFVFILLEVKFTDKEVP